MKTAKKEQLSTTFQSNPHYAIEVQNFTKRFRNFTAVDNIDLKVTKGKIHGFIGPNGSGKTTTIKSLIGAIVPTSGILRIYGNPSNSITAHKLLGYIPENARFPKHLHLKDYLTEMGYLRGMKLKTAKAKAVTIIDNLKLTKFKYKNPNTFSSGMKKKVLLAQALISDPEVLILDEPAANLDPTARLELFNDFKYVRSQGKTILICSHILSELQDIADEITILNYGKVVFAGAVISSDQNYYQFTVFEVPMLKDLENILINFGLKIYQKTADSIITQLSNPTEEIKKIAFEAFAKKIILTGIKPYVTNISAIYDNYVFSANKDFGNASAVVK